MAGYSTRAFVEVLAHHGVPAFTITADDVEHDVQTTLGLIALPDGLLP